MKEFTIRNMNEGLRCNNCCRRVDQDEIEKERQFNEQNGLDVDVTPYIVGDDALCYRCKQHMRLIEE